MPSWTTLLQGLEVQHYNDLTRSDIIQLTEILNDNVRSQADHKFLLRQLIHDLPSHLRSSKIGSLTSSCSLHAKLNPLPIKSLLQALRRVIEVDVPLVYDELCEHDDDEGTDTITVLEDLSALWLHPVLFEQKYERPAPSDPALMYQATRCASCILIAASCNVDALIAASACFIGGIKTSKWKRSTRVIWMEEWIRSIEGEEAVQDMWRFGVELRTIRKRASKVEGRDRSYIDDYIREAKSAEKPSHRQAPLRSPPQQGHAAFVEDALETEKVVGKTGLPAALKSAMKAPSEASSTTTSQDPSHRPTSSLSSNSASSIDARHSEESDAQADESQSSWTSRSPHAEVGTPGALYAAKVKAPCATEDDEVLGSPPLQTARNSITAQDDQSLSVDRASQAEDGVESASKSDEDKESPMDHVQTRRGAKKLRTVTIPVSYFDGLEEESEEVKKELQKRKTISQTPALRVGKNGEIKGPLDKISQASLASKSSGRSTGGQRRSWDRSCGS